VTGVVTVVFSASCVSADPTPLQIIQQAQTIFVIGMENHNFTQPTPTSSPQQISNNPAAPYINSLITPGNSNAVQVSFCTHYYNSGLNVHPSEPNYVWAEAGTDFGNHIDSDPTGANGNVYTANHLTRQLTAAGIAWKNYQEDVQLSSSPTNSASGTSGTTINPYYNNGQYNYGVKHNPMAFFNDTQTQNVFALTNLLRDLTNNSVGRYNWITPNQFNDQHTGLTGGFTYHGTSYTSDQAAIAQGDNFLAILIPRIMASSAYQNNGVIIIRWDETEGGDTTSYTIPEIIISPLAKGNAYASAMEYSHSSQLRTVEEIFGLNFLTNAIPSGETRIAGAGYSAVTNVNDLSDLLQAAPQIHVQQSAGNLTNGLGTVNFGTVNTSAIITNTFAVTNSGLGALNLTAFSVSGSGASAFTVSGIALPAALATGNSTNFSVAFAPTAGGAYSATLRITNNDVVRNPFTIALVGTGNAAPVVTVPANITVEATNALGNVVNFTVTASDSEDGALTPVVMPASGSVFAVGSNVVMAMATDSHGFSTTNSFAVIVQDTTPPVIALNGANPFTNWNTVPFVDPGATASDIVSGVVPVTTNGTVDVNTVGSYFVHYTAGDASGNSATNTRLVQVIPLQVPDNVSGAVMSDGSGFRLSFSAGLGQPYRVLGTDDLTQSVTNWTVFASGVVTNVPMTFTDVTPTNAFRFFRIVSP